MKFKLKHIFEYGLVRIVTFILHHVPYRIALFIGWGGAVIAFYLVRFRVKQAKERIYQIFGPKISSSRVRHIAWISWRNFVFNIVELIRIPITTHKWVRSVVYDNGSMNKLTSFLKSNNGAIFATFHMGPWELAALTCQAYHIPLFSIAARQSNPLVNKFMNSMRDGTGLEVVVRDASVLKTIIRNIRQGKVLAILPDVRAPAKALDICFLGKQANVPAGMAFIARKTNVPVFPFVLTRIGWTHHCYRIYDPIFPDPNCSKEVDSLRLTKSVFNIFDKHIRTEPEQWFWFNKRWLFDPID